MNGSDFASRVRILARLGMKPVPDLLRMAEPGRWRFWVTEAEQIVAISVLSRRAPQDPRFHGLLLRALKCPRQPKRSMAALALSTLKDPNRQSIAEHILRALEREDDAEVTANLLRSLGVLGDPEAEVPLGKLVLARNWVGSGHALVALWLGFALAKVGTDPTPGLQIIEMFLKADIIGQAYEPARKAMAVQNSDTFRAQRGLDSAVLHNLELLDLDKVAGRLGTPGLMHNTAALTIIVTLASRKLEAVRAAACLGERGTPLLPILRTLEEYYLTRTFREAVADAIAAIEGVSRPSPA